MDNAILELTKLSFAELRQVTKHYGITISTRPMYDVYHDIIVARANNTEQFQYENRKV